MKYICVCVYITYIIYILRIYIAYIYCVCRWLVGQPVLILWALYLANLMPAGDSNGLVSLV